MYVHFGSEKMRVDLAAQTPSRSVAESLDTLKKNDFGISWFGSNIEFHKDYK